MKLAGWGIAIALGAWLTLNTVWAAALPEPYASFVQAKDSRDLATLQGLAQDPGYVGVLAGFELISEKKVSAGLRANYAVRYANYTNSKYAWSRAGQALEEASRTVEAAQAYGQAYPSPEAASGLKRIAASPAPEAREAAYRALDQAGAGADLLGVLPASGYSEYRAKALYRLRRYGEALPHYQAWANADPQGAVGLGWTLIELGRLPEALQAFQRYPSPEGYFGQGNALEKMGQLDLAVAAYGQSTPAGIWHATQILETTGRASQAAPYYLRLAQMDDRLADDAAFRAWYLGQKYGDRAISTQAWELLSGGLAQIAGKALPSAPALPRAPQVFPPALVRSEALRQAGQQDWAREELLYALSLEPSLEEQIALVKGLFNLGEFRKAIRIAERWPLQYAEVIDLTYPRPYTDWIEAYAQANNLDPNLVYGIIRVESRFDPAAVSPTGAKGLMQFVTLTWQDVARMLGEAPGDPFDPKTNIRYGARYLRWLLDACNQDIACAVTSYNGGIGYVTRGVKAAGNFQDFLRFQQRDEPREYVDLVLGDYAAYQVLPGALAHE